MLTSNGYVLDESPARLATLEPVPPSERHNREALWRRLRSEGYLFLKAALDPERVQGFRRYYFSRLESATDVASLRRILFRSKSAWRRVSRVLHATSHPFQDAYVGRRR